MHGHFFRFVLGGYVGRQFLESFFEYGLHFFDGFGFSNECIFSGEGLFFAIIGLFI